MKILNHMQKGWYQVNNKADVTGEILLYNDIGLYGISLDDFQSEFDKVKNIDDLTVRINSYGGEVFVGFAIRNKLKEHKAKNKTIIIDGLAASIASVIATTPGYTLKMHKNAFMMVHKPSLNVSGNADDLRGSADVLDMLEKEIINEYKAKTKGKLSDEELSDMLKNETWLTASDAVKFGFADEILDESESDEPLTKSTNKLPENYRQILVNRRPAAYVNKGTVLAYCTICGAAIYSGPFCTQCGKNIQNYINGKPTSHQKSGEKEMSLRVIHDQSDKFRMKETNSLAVSLGIEKGPTIISEVRRNPGATDLHGLMRGCLLNSGTDVSKVNIMNPTEVYRNSVGSSDLPAILADVMHKALLAALAVAPGTYKAWVKSSTTNDFRPMRMLKMSGIGNIDLIPEGAPFKQATLSDSYEPIQVTTKGKVLNISRQAMLNNETNLLRDIPAVLARAVDNKKNRDCYDLLTSNALAGPTLHEDGKAVFHADHGNISANSGMVSVESISKAEGLLMGQKEIKPSPSAPDDFLNLSGKYLIAGTLQRIKTVQTIGSPFDPNGANSQVFNPYNNNYLYPVFDPYLQSLLTKANNPNGWYLTGDKDYAPSLVICYLNGQEEPSLRSENSRIGEAQGVSFEVFSDWGYAFNDYRSIVFNDGVTAS
jgi:ATP-dependent protease ClpP protease subunit